MNFHSIQDTILSHLDASDPKNSLLKVCELLNSNVKNYNWVGFYIMNHSTQNLHIGPYVGKPTDHIIIPFGKGICGQVAVSGETYIADDVYSEGNYIACSIDVQSEIVVPIYVNHQLVAQLDIDSNQKGAFTEEDDQFLMGLCEKLATIMGESITYKRFFKEV